MPSTTPDLSTITSGRFSGRASPPLASASVGGMRLLRHGGEVSPALARSAFGQGSSNGAGCGSSVSTGGTVALGRRSDDKRSGGSASLDRAWARSRSFRDVDENSKLRFGFEADGGGSGCIASGIG